MTAAVRAPVEVNFKAFGVEQVQRGLRLVGKEGSDAGKLATAGTGSLKQGAQGAASALAQMSGQMKLTNEGMKQMVTSGAELALSFGVGGPLVGALGLLGLTAYNIFSGVRKEMEETRKKAAEEVAQMLNSGDQAGLMKKARDLMQGQAGDVDAAGNAAPYSRGLSTQRQKIAEAQARADKLSFGGPGFTLKALREAQATLKTLKAEAAQFEKDYAAITAAILNPANAPRLTSGPQAIGTSATAPGKGGAATIIKQAKQTADNYAKLIADAMVESAANRPKIDFTLPEIDVSGAIKSVQDSIDKINNAAQERMTRLFDIANTGARMFGDVLSAGFTDGFAAAGRAMLSGLGGMLREMGEKALAGLILAKLVKDSISTFNPALGFAGAIGLIALGTGLQALGGKGGGGSSAGSSSSYSSPASAPIDTLRFPVSASMTPPSASASPSMHFTVIGNDPKVQRDIAAIVNAAMARNLIKQG